MIRLRFAGNSPPASPSARGEWRRLGGPEQRRFHGLGDWLLFLDSDDWLLPTAAHDLLETAESQECGVAYGMVLQRQKNALEPRRERLRLLRRAATPCLPSGIFTVAPSSRPGSALVKRSLFERTGGFVPGYEPMEDRDLWIKCGLLEPP